METIEFRICIEIRDNLHDKDITIPPPLSTEIIDEITEALNKRLRNIAKKRKGYVLVSFGPL